MLEGGIVLGIILLAAVAFMIFRITQLLGVVKKNHQKRITGSNKVNGLLLMAFMVIGLSVSIWFSYKYFDSYNLPVGSEHGVNIDRLFYISMIPVGLVFIITQVLLFWFSYKYQYSKDRAATYYPKNDKLEIIWTIIPSIVLATLVFGGWQEWTNITSESPEEAEQIEILGYQFAWKARYPGMDNELGRHDYLEIDPVNEFGVVMADRASLDDFLSRKVVLPVNQPVEFKIRARDVLHSVYAPHFRLKMDAVPGMPTSFWFVPTKTTAQMQEELGDPDFKYEIACTEVCGRGHFSMQMDVEVLEQDEYEAWYKEQKTLAQNPDMMAKVPESLKEVAMAKAGL